MNETEWVFECDEDIHIPTRPSVPGLKVVVKHTALCDEWLKKRPPVDINDPEWKAWRHRWGIGCMGGYYRGPEDDPRIARQSCASCPDGVHGVAGTGQADPGDRGVYQRRQSDPDEEDT